MSYTILYRKLFVRLPDDTFIALVEAGDNNVYTYDIFSKREVRDREFEAWRFGLPKLSYTRDEIAEWLDKMISENIARAQEDYLKYPHEQCMTDPKKDVLSHFGYWASMALYGKSTRSTSWSSVRRFFEDGVKNAIHVEDYFASCGGLRLVWYEGTEFMHSDSVRSLDELIELWNEMEGPEKPKPWIQPASEFDVRLIADLVGSAGRTGTTIKASIRENGGRYIDGYVKALFPFNLTDKKSDALTFRKDTLDKINIFRAFKMVSGKDFNRFSYEY